MVPSETVERMSCKGAFNPKVGILAKDLRKSADSEIGERMVRRRRNSGDEIHKPF